MKRTITRDTPIQRCPFNILCVSNQLKPGKPIMMKFFWNTWHAQPYTPRCYFLYQLFSSCLATLSLVLPFYEEFLLYTKQPSLLNTGESAVFINLTLEFSTVAFVNGLPSSDQIVVIPSVYLDTGSSHWNTVSIMINYSQEVKISWVFAGINLLFIPIHCCGYSRSERLSLKIYFSHCGLSLRSIIESHVWLLHRPCLISIII